MCCSLCLAPAARLFPLSKANTLRQRSQGEQQCHLFEEAICQCHFLSALLCLSVIPQTPHPQLRPLGGCLRQFREIMCESLNDSCSTTYSRIHVQKNGARFPVPGNWRPPQHLFKNAQNVGYTENRILFGHKRKELLLHTAPGCTLKMRR